MVGCFLGCFGSSSKDNITPHYRKIKILPQIQRNGSYEHRQSRFYYPKQDTNAKPESHISTEKDKHDEQLSLTISKNDAFDVNVKKDEPVTIEEDKPEEQSSLSTRNKDTSDANVKIHEPVSIEESKREERLGLRIRKKFKFDANVKIYELVPVVESTEALVENFQDNENQNEEYIEKPSLSCYPTNHRYNNCQECDEEVDELESEESYICDEDSSEYAEEDDIENYDETDEISSFDMSQSARDRGINIHPMLNPVTNLVQWNALKTKTKTKNVQENYKKKYRELAVDASLSNWLVSDVTSITTAYDGFKPTSPEIGIEDTSTFGAFSVEELGELNVSILLRKSPSRDSDSVGTYWSYSGSRVKGIGAAFSYKQLPKITSKYQEVLVK